MKPIQKILAPTDFSEAGKSALDEAITLARTLGASVTLLHVYQVPPAPPRMMAGYGAELIETLEASALQQLEKERSALRARTRDCPAIAIKAALGSEHEEIIREACLGGYDLVVMGTHGRTGFRHLLIGSVAERVVRLSPVPVLTVRPMQQPLTPAHP